jgi:hypothetical protein
MLAVQRDAATRHDHVYMGMMRHRRAPAVQHGSDADTRAQMLGVGRDRGQRLGRGLEQDVVDHRFVLIGDVGNPSR